MSPVPEAELAHNSTNTKAMCLIPRKHTNTAKIN